MKQPEGWLNSFDFNFNRFQSEIKNIEMLKMKKQLINSFLLHAFLESLRKLISDAMKKKKIKRIK